MYALSLFALLANRKDLLPRRAKAFGKLGHPNLINGDPPPIQDCPLFDVNDAGGHEVDGVYEDSRIRSVIVFDGAAKGSGIHQFGTVSFNENFEVVNDGVEGDARANLLSQHLWSGAALFESSEEVKASWFRQGPNLQLVGSIRGAIALRQGRADHRRLGVSVGIW